MDPRGGVYVGCVWLAIGIVCAIAAYWGLGIAGPSALPTVALIAGLAAAAIGLGVALWIGLGGRRLALGSMAIGFVLIGLAVLALIESDPTTWSGSTAWLLVGLAVVLTSAYAARVRR